LEVIPGGDLTTNTVGGHFSIFSAARSAAISRNLTSAINGVAFGVSAMEQTKNAIKGIAGKRLMYNQAH